MSYYEALERRHEWSLIHTHTHICSDSFALERWDETRERGKKMAALVIITHTWESKGRGRLVSLSASSTNFRRSPPHHRSGHLCPIQPGSVPDPTERWRWEFFFSFTCSNHLWMLFLIILRSIELRLKQFASILFFYFFYFLEQRAPSMDVSWITPESICI